MSIQTITGVPPIEFLSAGQPLRAWSISGNSQQTGTPTLDNPIIPDFCGERTVNLCPMIFSHSGIGDDAGAIVTMSTRLWSSEIAVLPSQSYYVMINGEASNHEELLLNRVIQYDANGVFISRISVVNQTEAEITTAENCRFVVLDIRTRTLTVDITIDDITAVMLSAGSQTTYEPYGYKLPITCGSQITPVYLGQTQTVRRVKKYVFTGEENGTIYSTNTSRKGIEITGITGIIGGDAGIAILAICTHYQPDTRNALYRNTDNGISNAYQNDNIIFYDANYQTVEAFQQFCAQQYAAGTPVTVWYVLENEQAGIVNEPLAKISDYADTVSSTNTGAPSIPTSKGSNTLTVETTLQPSEVSITYMSPNTIAENLQRLQIARTNIATAITAKGGTLVENAGFEDFPDAISSIPFINENYIASRYIDFEAPSTGFLIGNLSNINAFAGRRRCNVSDDGTIIAYYGDPSYTEDGSNGQVMVYQPKFYYKVEPLGLAEHRETVSGTSRGLGYHMTKAIYSISDQPLAGFKVHPAFKNEAGNEIDYILRGAFEGSLYDTSESVIVPYDDRMTLNGSTITIDFTADKLNSVAGVKPISGLKNNLTRANAEKLATNRGAGWHIETIQIASAEQILYMVEHAPNSQINTAAGVTGITDNTSCSCSSLTGSTSSLGNGTGRATSTVNEIGGTLNTYTGTTQTAVSYRGSENDWGNMWKFIIGCNIYGDGTMLGGIPYICSNFQFAEDVHASPYESAGFTVCNSDGWTKAFGYGNEEYDWLFMPSKVGAPSDGSGMIGDFLYKTTNLNGHRIAVSSSNWSTGSVVGLFTWFLNIGSSGRDRIFSARLCYVPQN
jgi:hypothetical protein